MSDECCFFRSVFSLPNGPYHRRHQVRNITVEAHEVDGASAKHPSKEPFFASKNGAWGRLFWHPMPQVLSVFLKYIFIYV